MNTIENSVTVFSIPDPLFPIGEKHVLIKKTSWHDTSAYLENNSNASNIGIAKYKIDGSFSFLLSFPFFILFLSSFASLSRSMHLFLRDYSGTGNTLSRQSDVCRLRQPRFCLRLFPSDCLYCQASSSFYTPFIHFLISASIFVEIDQIYFRIICFVPTAFHKNKHQL